MGLTIINVIAPNAATANSTGFTMTIPASLTCTTCLALVFAVGAVPARAADAPAPDEAIHKAAAALYEGMVVQTLPNGLRVYLKPIPGAPVVTTMVAYKVGSADENLDATGLSHYLEHLMFKGTDKILPGDIDRITLKNGGSNNAYTDTDYTIFHFDFAADRWEKALEIEADRMQNLRIDDRHEFEKEKEVVVSELESDEDQPWDLEQKAILPLLFGTTAPYGHPVIGERAHVRSATAPVIKGHYDSWYAPNNAALVVCGGFDPAQAMGRIQQLFGAIPTKQLPARKMAGDAKRPGPIVERLSSKFEVPRLLMGFNTVRSGDADFYALEVLQAILSNGKTSRLYRKLVEGDEIAGSIGSSNTGGRYPGWFSVQVELLKGKSTEHADKLVLAELKRLRDEPASPEELARVKRGILVNAIMARESVHGLADSIARGVTTNDLDYLKSYLPRIAAVTAQDVQVAAKKYLDPAQSVVVWSMPGKQAGAGRGAFGFRISDFGFTSRIREPQAASRKRSAAEVGGAKDFSLKDAKRVVLDNGLTLLLFENHRLPIVVAAANVFDTRLHEPAGQSGLAALTGRLLDEGSDQHSGPEIAELIENAGGTLELNTSGGSVSVLSPDRGLGLRLLFECLSRARFPQEAFAREQVQQLSEIEDAWSQPDTRATMVFREIVYGGHPWGRSSLGNRQTVTALTREACVTFHRKVFVPNNTAVALVGDFDGAAIVEEIKKLTAGWKRAEIAKPHAGNVDKPQGFVERILTMPASAQLHFYLGHVGVRRANPDFYKLLVMDYVLGTGPGFTDRLSAQLRDREGLAYTVSANISSSAAEEPGVFTCYIGTDPKNYGLVKQRFLLELNRIRDEPPKAHEVEDAKQYLLGNLPFNFTTNAQIAGQLLVIDRFQLGFGYLAQFRQAVSAVTAADVQAVARQYLDPGRMALVAAGAIDAKGKPLPSLPPPKQ